MHHLNAKGFMVVIAVFVFFAGLAALAVVQEKGDGAAGPKGKPVDTGDTGMNLSNRAPYVGPQPANPAPQEKMGTPFLIPPVPNNQENPLRGVRVNALPPGLDIGKDIRAMPTGWTPMNFNIYGASLYMDERGVLYCAFQAHYGSNPAEETYIHVEKSTNGGLAWENFGWVWKTDINLTDPSVYCTNDTVIVAYVVNESGKDPYVETAYRSRAVGYGSMTSVSILHDSPVHELNPFLFGDHEVYPTSSSAYLTFEHLYDDAALNINILFERTGDDGASWKDMSYIFGAGVGDEYRQPFGCFGETTGHYLYIVGYNKTTKTVVLMRSADWGVTWGSQQNLVTLTTEPSGPGGLVMPVIAASRGGGTDNALLFYAIGTASEGNNLNYLLSTNHGEGWSGPSGFVGNTTGEELGPWLWAGPNGDKFHIYWTEGVSHAAKYIANTQAFGGYSLSDIRQVNRGGLPSWDYAPIKGMVSHWTFDFPSFIWLDYSYDSPYYHPYFNRFYPEDLVGTWSGQGVYYRTDVNTWHKLATAADQITAGDITGDGTGDIVGLWPAQAGIWARRSDTGAWVYLGTSARDIACGDFDNDGVEEFVGTWDGQGCYYLTAIGGSWMKIASPADLVAASDLDGDGIADLVGIWAGQGGVWVKKSTTGTWQYLSTSARHIAAADMDGDGTDELVGTWDGQGCYYLTAIGGSWVSLATPATIITAGDLDADYKADLIGVWPAQAGVWVKYSSDNSWSYLGSAPVDISAALMRGGSHTWGAQSIPLFQPVGGGNEFPSFVGAEDYGREGPGGSNFRPLPDINLVPNQNPAEFTMRVAGPSEPGFNCETTPNPFPGSNLRKKARIDREK
jgi:hypothetical protein